MNLKNNNLNALDGLKKSFNIMVQKVRSKFVCVSVEDQPTYEQKVVSFSPVISGSEENKSFAKYTPRCNAQ